MASCEFASLSFDKSDNDGQENNSIKVPFIQNAFPYKIQYGGFSFEDVSHYLKSPGQPKLE